MFAQGWWSGGRCVFTTRRYTNPHLPYPYLIICFTFTPCHRLCQLRRSHFPPPSVLYSFTVLLSKNPHIPQILPTVNRLYFAHRSDFIESLNVLFSDTLCLLVFFFVFFSLFSTLELCLLSATRHLLNVICT